MSQNVSLKEIEKRVLRSFFKDGLWDIYFGLIFLALSLLMVVENTTEAIWARYAVLLAACATAGGVLWGGKRYLTIPRVGRAKLGIKSNKRMLVIHIALSASVIFGLVVFGLAAWGTQTKPDWLAEGFAMPAIWLANIMILAGLGALLFNYHRLVLIGLLYGLAAPVDFYFHKYMDIDLGFLAFMIPSLLIIIMGVVILIRFLRDYPVLDVNGSDDPGEEG